MGPRWGPSVNCVEVVEGVEQRRLREVAADAVPSAVLVVHHSGALAVANAAARRMFGLGAADIGRPFRDLEIFSRPVDLRPAVELVLKEPHPMVLEQVDWGDGPAGIDCLDIHVVPVVDSGGDTAGASLTFVDASASRRLREELEGAERNLEAAYDELRSTTRQLERTNDELERMNAELHSTKEVLQTIDDELRQRTAELDEVSDFLESLLISQPGAQVVLDRDLRITVWNDRAADLWGLRREAPGRHFLDLGAGLPAEELEATIRAVLAGGSLGEQLVVGATDRRGRDFRCQVSITPLLRRDGPIRGAILLMEEVEPA